MGAVFASRSQHYEDGNSTISPPQTQQPSESQAPCPLPRSWLARSAKHCQQSHFKDEGAKALKRKEGAQGHTTRGSTLSPTAFCSSHFSSLACLAATKSVPHLPSTSAKTGCVLPAERAEMWH